MRTTRLYVSPLEPRDCPAFAGGDGFVTLDSGERIDVYGPGWRGHLNVTEDDHAVYVGPGPGGGPRLATLDRDTGDRLVNDRWAGPEASREGLVPLLANAVPDARPDGYTVGTGAYPVFLAGATDTVVDQTAAYFAPLLAETVRFTNKRPDQAPETYLTVAFDAPTGWSGVVPPPRGVADVGIVADPHNGVDQVYVRFPGTNGHAAYVAAHEAGHALGLLHVDDPGNVMHANGGQPGGVFAGWQYDAMRATVGF